MAAGGASNKGVVIRITPAGTGAILHSFAGGAADGDTPLGSLIQGRDGNLYGVTSVGGTTYNGHHLRQWFHRNSHRCPRGYGAIFNITPAGVETVLHSFSLAEGANPESSLTQAAYRITPSGVESLLYSFAGLRDGAWASGSLVEDGNAPSDRFLESGRGVVWRAGSVTYRNGHHLPARVHPWGGTGYEPFSDRCRCRDRGTSPIDLSVSVH
jgi:hypothetical protein